MGHRGVILHHNNIHLSHCYPLKPLTVPLDFANLNHGKRISDKRKFGVSDFSDDPSWILGFPDNILTPQFFRQLCSPFVDLD